MFVFSSNKLLFKGSCASHCLTVEQCPSSGNDYIEITWYGPSGGYSGGPSETLNLTLETWNQVLSNSERTTGHRQATLLRLYKRNSFIAKEKRNKWGNGQWSPFYVEIKSPVLPGKEGIKMPPGLWDKMLEKGILAKID